MNSPTMNTMTSSPDTAWNDVSFTTRDGLRLYGRHYAAGGSRRRAVLCLPGLTRNSRDFHDLALLLSDPRGHRRDVYTLDSRGRGLSDSDPDWKNYTVQVEVTDALDFITRLDLTDAAVLGTSRGGLLAMGIAAARPAAMGAVILNDIGPVIDRNGLSRIMAYVSRVPLPGNWVEAGRLVGDMSREAFPKLTNLDCEALARQWFNDAGGRPAPAYDPAIARTFTLPEGPLPDLWRQFGALTRVPALVLRGANSDLISDATVAEMGRRHPDLTSHLVPSEGHAPLLRDSATQGVIQAFLMRTDPVLDALIAA